MTGSAPADSWRFRPHIEGLRAVAILGVMLFHAGIPGIPGGFLGVDVFFVISGFLITGILCDEVGRTGTVSLAAFWGRRARRLLPAATLVGLVTLLFALAFDAPFVQQSHARSALSFATYWSNLRFMVRGADYFDHGMASDPFLHTWSLGVEEQFYLGFAPLVFLLACAIPAGDSARFRRRLWLGAGLATLVSLAVSWPLTLARPLVAFYALPARVWEFGVGALLALWLGGRIPRRARFEGGLLALGLAAVLLAWLLASDRTATRVPLTLVLVGGTALLIGFGGRGPTLIGRVLEAPLMTWLGRLSYSWYLWHWPIAVYWAKLAPPALPLALGMPLVSLLLAQLTYVTLEAPARRSPLLATPRHALAAALLFALATSGAGLAALWNADRRLGDPAYAFILDARNTETRMNADGCQLKPSAVRLKDCAYGDPAAATTIVLFGDSHAARWFPALERGIAERRWQLVPMTKSGCPSVAVPVWRKALGRAYSECDRWRDNVFARLAELHPAVVLLSNSYWHDVVGDSLAGVIPAPPPPALWRRGLQTTLARLPQSSAVLLLADVPYPRFDVPACLVAYVHEVERCAFSRDSAVTAEQMTVEREVGRGDPRVTYMDLTDQICGRALCPAARGDTALFSDTDHLAVRFAASLSSWLLPALDSILTAPRRPAPRAP